MNKKKDLLFSLLILHFIGFPQVSFGQKFDSNIGERTQAQISNVQARQEGLEVIITYNMAGKLQPGDEIMVGYSYPPHGGRYYKPINDAEGDVGKNVKLGNDKEISFFVFDKLTWDDVSFKVGTIVDFPPSGMVYVEGGTFQMGSHSGNNDEKPNHPVDNLVEKSKEITVSGFFMDTTEVTQAEYEKVMLDNPSWWKPDDPGHFSWQRSNGYEVIRGTPFPGDIYKTCPVERITLMEVILYCNALSNDQGLDSVYTYDIWTQRSGYASRFINIRSHNEKNGYRLPTEAEWEFAARGGNKSRGYKYSGSNDLDVVGWKYKDDWRYRGSTHPVAQKQPNELGLYDMSGNVWEWCLGVDPFEEKQNYRSLEKQIVSRPRGGSYKFSGGGHSVYSRGYIVFPGVVVAGWQEKFSDKQDSSTRRSDQENTGNEYRNNIGFRCVSTAR